MDKTYGLYIHIPFCAQKCHYCDFNSIVADNDLIVRYIAALKKEIQLLAEQYQPQINTIYIGGGTPSLLSGENIINILEKCEMEFELDPSAEITIESNPGTLTERKLKLIKKAGINRLSMGVQSFNNDLLKKLGRIHTTKDVINNYYLARELGFDNLSFDLMFALPGQDLKDWEETLNQAIKLGPEHLSTYNLKIESGTTFAQWLKEGKLETIDEELDLQMYRRTIELLANNNYQQYEISNFSKLGYNSKHNKIYWLNKPYLALGAGAHFYDGEYRGYNLSSIKKYCQRLEMENLAIAEKNKLSRLEKIEETMMLGLRLNQGVSLTDFYHRFNQSLLNIYQEEIDKLVANGLILVDENKVLLTDQGRELANRVLASFILT